MLAVKFLNAECAECSIMFRVKMVEAALNKVESRFYPPVGTEGVVIQKGFNGVFVAWDNGIKGWINLKSIEQIDEKGDA